MSDGSFHDCPDCGTHLTPIRVLDNAGQSGQIEGLAYTTCDAKRSLWTGAYPTAGIIQAELCPRCGRVVFYATPSGGSLPLPSTAPEPDRDQLPLPSSADPAPG